MLEKDIAICMNILEAIEKVMEITKDITSSNDLKSNYIYFDAIMMNFIIIGEMSNKLSNDFKDQAYHIEWRKTTALRNIIAHDYFGIDEEEIWQIIRNNLPILKSDLIKIVRQINQ